MRLLYHSGGAPSPGELDRHTLAELYHHRAPVDGGVWLRSNFVTSLDLSVVGDDGRAGSINTPSDQHVFALHRAHADVVLVGAQTVRTEGYRAVDLVGWQRELRAAEHRTDFPLLAIVTRSLDLDPRLVGHGTREVGPVVVFTTSGHRPDELVPFTQAGVEVVESGSGDVDLSEVTRHLAARGRVRVLCEGGPRLHQQLLAQGLVDELSLTVSPLAVAAGPSATSGGGRTATQRNHYALQFTVLAADDTVFLHYRRRSFVGEWLSHSTQTR